MKVKELITELLNFNMEAEMNVIVHNKCEGFSITWGGSDGCSKRDSDNVSLYVDKLNSNEHQCLDENTR